LTPQYKTEVFDKMKVQGYNKSVETQTVATTYVLTLLTEQNTLKAVSRLFQQTAHFPFLFDFM
jgi:hypothetical protein